MLFVVPWFLPIWDVKGDTMMPAAIWVILFAYPSHFGETLTFIAMFCLLVGVPAISLGWVLHCVAVMVRDARKPRGQNAG